jgi:hypothetical protein
VDLDLEDAISLLRVRDGIYADDPLAEALVSSPDQRRRT